MSRRSERLSRLLDMSRFNKRTAAEGMGISESALRKWLSGTRPMPADIELQIAGVMREHAARLENVARQLEAMRQQGDE